jgi:hypothetical protein
MSLHDTLMDLVYDVTVLALGLDSDSNPQNILPMNPMNSPAGLTDPSNDFAFYRITLTDDQYNRQMDVTNDGDAGDPTTINRTTKYVRPLRIKWMCYGVDAMEYSDTIRIMLYDPAVKALLAAQGITLVPNIPSPQPAWEPKGGQWYQRYDLHADFYQLVTLQSEIPVIASDEVIIYDEKGEVADINA